jgi:valyl-tRNA synthetase
MRGKSTLWIPGTDHAGIATQLLVERALVAEGISRQIIGREKFLERVWEWKEEKGGYITQQMRRLGASADWSREKFTLEPTMSQSVTEAFIILFERGLIYKGSYLVNWSPNLQTAVSDLEVEYSEELGTLYYFKYMLSDGSNEYIPVSTTRPETILGDTAICVHPEDDRYSKFIGKMVKVPMQERTIPGARH